MDGRMHCWLAGGEAMGGDGWIGQIRRPCGSPVAFAFLICSEMSFRFYCRVAVRLLLAVAGKHGSKTSLSCRVPKPPRVGGSCCEKVARIPRKNTRVRC